MNKIESIVYNLVKNNYLVKNAVRNVYQGFYDLMPNYESKFAAEPIVKEGCFLGFHDIDPFSPGNKRILAGKLTIPLRMPEKGDRLEVGFWAGENFAKWKKLADTCAWNYHKGCRLQWLDGRRCIFNTAENDELRAEIVDVETGEKTMVGWPIDTVSRNGKYATSFSYQRLQKMMPGYGYLYSDPDSFLCEPVTSRTGLFLVDISAKTRELLLELETISRIDHEPEMDGAFHFVTHTEFSYDGRYVSFLHRWYNGTMRRTRLMVYDLAEKKVFVSPTSGMVSHYVWNRKNGIVAYCSVEGVDSHVYFAAPDMKEYKRCGYPKLNSDGHHCFIDDGHFVVDTYPDKYRHAKLYRVSIDSDKVELIADVRSYKRFASPNEQTHWACDLHPRCSADGRWLSFDSVHTGERSLCIMENPAQGIQ